MRAGTYGLVAFLVLLLGASGAALADANPSPAAAPTQSPAAAASQASDADVMASAKAWLHRLQTGEVDNAARAQLSDIANSALTPAVLKAAAAQFGPLGEPQSFTFLGKQPAGGQSAYVYRVVFKSATLNEIFVLNKDGKITGIQLPPAQ